MNKTTEDRLDRIESALRWIADRVESGHGRVGVDEILNPQKPLTLAQKFQEWRQKCATGSGSHYWEGLAKIAEQHYTEQAFGKSL